MNDPATKKLLKSEWLYTAAGPLQRGWGLVIQNDRIHAVGEIDSFRHEHQDAEMIDVGDAIILPGLVNAHTHLELSQSVCGEPADSFVDWILRLQSRRAAAVGRDPTEMYSKAIAVGVAQCLKFGVTCVGDITQRAAITRAALQSHPIRAVSYGEVLGLGKLRPRYEQLLTAAIDASLASKRVKIGLTPHAPYTVELGQYRECLKIAHERNLPLATHLAETPGETEFLEHHAGPFRTLFDRIGEWTDDFTTFNGNPIAMARAIGLLDYPMLLAHVNYCDDAELAMLASGVASVVYCPRTHRYFGHSPHRWREMLAAGINVAAGTDSCASSPDLNLVDELRLLHEIAPKVSVEEIWSMATIRAARAIQWDDQLGSIARGNLADLTIFDVKTNDPLREILEDRDRLPRQVWIGGEELGRDAQAT